MTPPPLWSSSAPVAPQWALRGGGPHQARVGGLPAEGEVLLCPPLQGPCRRLWTLLEQRSLLLLLQESGRRLHLAVGFQSRVRGVLEETLQKPPHIQIRSSPGLGVLGQELRVHLNHWPSLLSRIHSDPYLRRAVVQRSGRLQDIERTLDCVALQVLVLMERLVLVLLTAMARTDPDSVPRDVLEDISAGVNLYNAAVEEQRARCGTTMQGTQWARPRPAALRTKELLRVLTVHHAERAAKQLQTWTCGRLAQLCPLHNRKSTLRSSARRPPRSPGCGPARPLQPPALGQQVRLSAELLLQLLLPAPTASHRSTPEESDPQRDSGPGPEPQQDQHLEAEGGTRPGVGGSSCGPTAGEAELEVGMAPALDELIGQYQVLLWSLCSRALWLHLQLPPAGGATESLGLQGHERALQLLHLIRPDPPMDAATAMMEEFSLKLCVWTEHAQWDQVLCAALGSAVKDKCLSSSSSSGMMSVTMEHFLLLFRPLLTSLGYERSNTAESGSTPAFPSSPASRRPAVVRGVATLQLASVWLSSRAQHFLSSWSVGRFLLIVQGDLTALRQSSETFLSQIKSVLVNMDSDHESAFQNHSRILLSQQVDALDRAVSELQSVSSVLLKSFSVDCKRRSEEIFEDTMPSSVHWRPSHRAAFPSSPSEYASLAAQAVIGQVLEGVAPLSDEARAQALGISTTAFLEAWLQHILKQRIQFSVHGALQLKQDFDSIRALIQSEKFGLSAELHQRLLSLRVFQQVDSAVMCLLQQPQEKPYLRSRTWKPFTRCCPGHRSNDSVDAATGSSITNLRSMEAEELTPPLSSSVTPDLLPVNPSTSGEPYLVPSVSVGAAQQQWLDLRISSRGRRWRLPGLECLSNSEP